MSRTKKSRKPGSGSIGVVKDDKKKLATPAPRKPKKKNGKEAGNRQKEATASVNNQQSGKVKKDPRIGSKTPIDLGKVVKAPIKTKPVKKVVDSSPIAAIRIVETGESLTEQLSRIEQDPRLLEILKKQDNEIALSPEEIDYYNELMEKHEKISQELGLDEDEEAVVTSTKANSEDDLWDKFDNSDLSRFE